MVDYSSRFTKEYRLQLLVVLARLWLVYTVRNPYFRDIPQISYHVPKERKRPRWRVTFYSIMYGLLLTCYRHPMGGKLRSGSEHVLFLMIDLVKALDDCMDEAGRFAIGEFLYLPLLKERRDALERYLDYEQAAIDVISYLKGTFTEHYGEYTSRLDQAKYSLDFDDVLRVVELDSMWLHITMEVVALFNGQSLSEQARKDFHMLGLIGKFADDMTDVPYDIEKNRVNLLYCLLMKAPEELALVREKIVNPERLSAEWWYSHAPVTTREYFRFVNDYFSQIESPMIRRVSDLVMLPVILGREYDLKR